MKLKKVIQKSTLLSGHGSFNSQIGDFMKNSKADEILEEIRETSQDDWNEDKLNKIIETSCEIAFKSKDSKKYNYSNSSLFISTLLSAIHPSKFVDYRQSVWNKLALSFGIEEKFRSENYGLMILKAQELSSKLINTEIFNKYFTKYTQDIPANYIIAGLAKLLVNSPIEKHIPGIEFWLVGADEDSIDNLIEKGIWENNNDEKINYVKTIKVNDKNSIKKKHIIEQLMAKKSQ